MKNIIVDHHKKLLKFKKQLIKLNEIMAETDIDHWKQFQPLTFAMYHASNKIVKMEIEYDDKIIENMEKRK